MPKPEGQTEFLNSLFQKHVNEHGEKEHIETRSNLLREWYRKGQATFRQVLAQDIDQVEFLNYIQQELSGDGKEGFLMGWQSDAYAHQHGLGLSFEGTDRQEVEDVSYAWQD